MRTSKISRDTGKAIAALSPRKQPPRDRRTPTLQSFGFSPEQSSKVAIKQAPDPESESELSSVPSDLSVGDDFENVGTITTTTRKRKRGADEPAATTTTDEITPKRTPLREILKWKSSAEIASPNGKAKRARRQPAKKIKTQGGVKVEPPAHWEEVYNLTKEMRSKVLAPVDTMGCESLADKTRSPRDQRFQTLVSLMLSAQTKDTVTAVAMRNLQQNLPGGFTLESILAVDHATLDRLISKVGFHSNKARYIKQTAEVLRDRFGGDIPDTIEGLTSLPGVGPKMAYLTMSAAWGRDEGIGVDVHVHRITNLWGWHKTKNPEETRAALEAWLPKDRWHEINKLLVGFGQTICLPVGRRCGQCLLAEKGLCPGAIVGKEVKKRVKKEEVVQDNGEVVVKEEVEVGLQNIKAEDVGEGTEVPDIEDLGASRVGSKEAGS